MTCRTPHRVIFSIISAALLAALAPGCTNSDAAPQANKEIWRFAIEEAEGSVQHEYALQFEKLIEQRTGGAVDVVVYPYGTLGTSTQMTEQLNMGAIELAMASPGSLGKFIPELQVFLLHFVLPPDERRIKQVLSDPKLVAYFDRLYAPKGLKLLSIYSEGQMVWTMNKEVRRPVDKEARSPKDFGGLKMRVMTSPILLSAYSAYGASPTPMPYSEVYSGLQLNTIEGQVNPIFAIERQKFYEVTSWLIFPGHTSFTTTCAANRKFFDRLSPQRRELMSNVIGELDDYIFDVQTRFQSERLKDILRDKKRQQADYYVCGDISRLTESFTAEEKEELIDENPHLHLVAGLTDKERAAFRRASQSVRDVFLQIGGPDSREVLQRVLSASEK